MLSERMKTVAAMVKKCELLADIGTDHAYIPIELYKHNLIKRAIASDISEGSCEKARANISFYGLSDFIEVRCGDGLTVLNENELPSCILISGMGGQLMLEVLSGNLSAVCAASQLVLQPQKDIDRVRRFIHSIGFKIENEILLCDMGKYYTVMSAVKGEEHYTEAEYLIGKCLINNGGEIFDTYINYQYNKINNMILSLEKSSSVEAKQRRLDAIHKRQMYEEVIICR